MPVHPDFDIEAGMPDDTMPDWTELFLAIGFSGSNTRHMHHLTRQAGELIIDALHETLHPYAGNSINQIIWDKLLEVTQRLKRGDVKPDGEPVWKARAQTLTWVIAVHRNPYDPMAAYEAVKQEALDATDDD